MPLLYSLQLIRMLHSVPKEKLFCPSPVTGTSCEIQTLRFSTFGTPHPESWKGVGKCQIMKSLDCCLSQAVWYRTSVLFALLLRPLFREIFTSIFSDSTLLSSNEHSFYSNAVQRGEVHTVVSGRYQKTIFTWLAAFLLYNWMVDIPEREALKLKKSVRKKRILIIKFP